MDACHQFIKCEGLTQIIIGAGVQAGHPVFHLGAGCQHKHCRRKARRAYRLANRWPISARQHPIYDSHIMSATQSNLNPGISIVNYVHVKMLALQDFAN